MTLFLIRHGQTTANLDGIYSGQSDVPLTELGRSQAEAIRPILEKYSFDQVYSSDLSRAVNTAKLAIPGCQPIELPQLREIRIGSATGESIAKIRKDHGFLNSDFRRFGGENMEMIDARAAEFLSILEKDPTETVAAFSHNGFMKAVVRLVLKAQIDATALPNGNCNIAVLKYDGTKWTLPVWNLAGISREELK